MRPGSPNLSSSIANHRIIRVRSCQNSSLRAGSTKFIFFVIGELMLDCVCGSFGTFVEKS